MYNSIVFSTFTELCDHNLILEHFHQPPKGDPVLMGIHSLFPPPPLATTNPLSVSTDQSALWTFHIDGITHCVDFGD